MTVFLRIQAQIYRARLLKFIERSLSLVVYLYSMQVLEPQIKLTIFADNPVKYLDLKNPFFSSHLITYIGNKRRLLPFFY